MKIKKEGQTSAKIRALSILKEIIEDPEKHTSAYYAEKHNVDRSSIKRDIDAMRKAGWNVRISPYPDYLIYLDEL